jgi:histidinol-phosphatase
MKTDLDGLMDFAVQSARKAGLLTLEHFGSALVEFKGDGSEVTVADHAAEALLRDILREAYPLDGIVGEEGVEETGRSGRRWILDPIDGTRSFSCGVPLYGILIALEEHGSFVLGCCHFPAIGETLVAARGAGAWHNGRRARVSECEEMREARLVTSGLEYWRDWGTDSGRQGFETLTRATRFTRTWGDAYGYALVATGRSDLMADPAVGALWDVAPMVPILSEAGGVLTTLRGGAVGPWTSGLASNRHLHAEALRCWEGLPDPLADPGR